MPGDFPFLTTDVSDEFLCVCVCSEHSLSDGDVDRRSLGARSRPLTEMLPLSRLRSFGNLLCFPLRRLHVRAHFARAGQKWTKPA